MTLLNLVYRPSYYNHYYNIKYMDHCYDCTYAYEIIKSYRSSYNNKYTKMSMIKLIEHIINEIKTYNKLETDNNKILHSLKY